MRSPLQIYISLTFMTNSQKFGKQLKSQLRCLGTGKMANITGTNSNDLLNGTPQTDAIFGLSGDDTISGLQGQDTLYGNSGNDLISGGESGDILRGGKGNDSLDGGAGSDNLYGDGGRDTLTGGEGFDNFVLSRSNMGASRIPRGPSLDDADIITDYNAEQDSIGLLRLSFENLNISNGTGELANSAIIQDKVTGEFLAIVREIDSSKLVTGEFRTFVQPSGPYSNSTADPGKIDSGIPGFVGPDGDGKISANNRVNPRFVAWATGFENYQPAPGVDARFQTPEKTLGPVASKDNFIDIASLGDLDRNQIDSGVKPGQITLTFSSGIRNGSGQDFAVFENGFNNAGGVFGELAYVEVSSNGINFARFKSDSLTGEPVSKEEVLDPTNIYNLAGKHVNNAFTTDQGELLGGSWGTPFDLETLATDALVTSGQVNLNAIRFVRIVDIPGSGSFKDGANRAIYDPWATTPPVTSGGFDLEAVGVFNII